MAKKKTEVAKTTLDSLSKEAKNLIIKLRASGYSISAISKVFKLKPSEVEEFVQKNADKIAQKKESFLDLLEDNLRLMLTNLRDIIPTHFKKAPLNQQIAAIDRIYDKYRLETGKSINNFSLNVKVINEITKDEEEDQ